MVREEVHIAWARDRQLAGPMPKLMPRWQRLPTLRRVVQRASTVDEVYLAMWIIDRLPHPEFMPYQEAASLIAYKVHGTTSCADDRKMTVYARRHKRVSDVGQLQACELHALRCIDWKMPSVCIIGHMRSIIRVAGGDKKAEKHIGNGLMRVLLHCKAPMLPETAIAVATFCMAQRSADQIIYAVGADIQVSLAKISALVACVGAPMVTA